MIEIITWWELRRLPYNLAVGTAGVCTLLVTIAVSALAAEKLGEPLGLPDPPIVAVLAVIGYGVAANICFTGGWIAEILVQKIWQERAGAFAQISFALGLLFSILLTLTPAVVLTALLVFRLLVR